MALFTLRSERIAERYELTLTDRKTSRDTVVTAWARRSSALRANSASRAVNRGTTADEFGSRRWRGGCTRIGVSTVPAAVSHDKDEVTPTVWWVNLTTTVLRLTAVRETVVDTIITAWA